MALVLYRYGIAGDRNADHLFPAGSFRNRKSLINKAEHFSRQKF